MTFRIDLEWENGAGVSDPAMAATWARIAIRIGDTQVRAYDVKDVRSGFYGSVLPLAEWIAESWPRLVHERMLPIHSAEHRRWRGFHSFQAAREGGAMPDLRVRRIDTQWANLELIPDGRSLPGVSVRFLDPIRERVPIGLVEKALQEVVALCSKRLEATLPAHETALQSTWLRNMAPLAGYAARLEPDEEAFDADTIETLKALSDEPLCDLVVEIAEALPRRIPLRDRIAMARQIGTSLDPAPASKRWLDLRGLSAKAFARPWLTGWAATSRLREELSLTDDYVFDGGLATFCAKRLGWPVDRQIIMAPKVLPEDLHVDTIHARSNVHLPCVLTRHQSPGAQQFRVARSLYYSLVAGSKVEQLEAIVDVRHAPLFSEASAFAAELLAPAAYLQQQMPRGGIWPDARVNELAQRLMVSSAVIRHQIENREIGELEDAYE